MRLLYFCFCFPKRKFIVFDNKFDFNCASSTICKVKLGHLSKVIPAVLTLSLQFDTIQVN